MDDGADVDEEEGGTGSDPRPRHQPAHCATSYKSCVFSGGRKKAARIQVDILICEKVCPCPPTARPSRARSPIRLLRVPSPPYENN